MNQEQLNDIIHKHFREIGTYIKKIKENFDIEDIHQFRVEYKKLRAFLRMLSHQKKMAGEFKISKKLKKYYHIAGEIRDLQLQQQRILATTKPSNKKPQAYLNLLQQQIDTLKAELGEIVLDKAVSTCKKKTAKALPEYYKIRDFNAFVKQKWNTVNTIILHRYLSDNNIHTIRKNLKDLVYNLKVIEAVEKRAIAASELKGNGEAYFDNFLLELGKYHDRCIAISLLKSTYLNSLNSYTRELLERIKLQWKKEKLHIRQLLVKQLKTEIAPQ